MAVIDIATTDNSEIKGLRQQLTSWWTTLAYHHKWAEAMLYMMFFSGLLLWGQLDVSWQIKRVMLLLHMVVGVSLFTVIVGAFWSSHRNLLNRSKKRFLRQTGTIIEWLLVLCSVTGFYLFFYGDNGNQLGWVMHNVHFYTSWLLVPLVFAHAFRWSVLNIRQFLSKK